MLHDITWKQFLITLLIVLLIYYGILLTLYYRNAIQKLFTTHLSGNLKRITNTTINATGTEETESNVFSTPNNWVESDFIDAVKKIAKEKSFFDGTEQGLTSSLHTLFAATPASIKSNVQLRSNINKLIISISVDRLTDGSGNFELDKLWDMNIL